MIGRFLNQRVLERIDRLWDKAGFVQEFGGLELCQALRESLLGQPGNGSEEREGHLLPNDSRVLQHTFSDRWQAIYTSRKHRMDRIWDGGWGMHSPLLCHTAGQFFQKEWIAIGFRYDLVQQCRGHLRGGEQGLDHLGTVARCQP